MLPTSQKWGRTDTMDMCKIAPFSKLHQIICEKSDSLLNLKVFI